MRTRPEIISLNHHDRAALARFVGAAARDPRGVDYGPALAELSDLGRRRLMSAPSASVLETALRAYVGAATGTVDALARRAVAATIRATAGHEIRRRIRAARETQRIRAASARAAG